MPAKIDDDVADWHCSFVSNLFTSAPIKESLFVLEEGEKQERIISMVY